MSEMISRKSPVYDPGKCRCCGTLKKCRVLNIEYCTNGQREVYSDMVMDCFGILLSHLDAEPTERLICAKCVMRLRDACSFKQQVLECEQSLLQAKASVYSDDPIKLTAAEIKQECNDDSDHCITADGHVESMNKIEIKIEPLTQPMKNPVPKITPLTKKPVVPVSKRIILPSNMNKMIGKNINSNVFGRLNDANLRVKRDLFVKLKQIKERMNLIQSKSNKKMGVIKIGTNKSTDVLKNLRPLKYNKNSIRQINKDSALALIMFTTSCPFKRLSNYICMYCSESFYMMPQLMEHTRNEHGSYDEFQIRKTALEKSKIDTIKLNFEEFGCKLCDGKLEGFNELKTHLVEKHNKKIDLKNDGVIPYKISSDKFECVHCRKVFDKYRHLNIHIKEHYTNFFCDQCGTGFMTADRLKGHMVTHQKGEYPCSICNKVFKNEVGRSEHHKSVHRKVKRNLCNVCNESFSGYLQKMRHLVDIHGLKVPEYKCSYCPKVYLLASACKIHEKQAHIKPHIFSCDQCDYKHHSKSSLKRHMVCHTNDRIYKCEVCHKAYARSRTLKEHMRIHNNDRRYACEHCGRAFVQKCSLKGHMKTHHKDILFE